MAEGQDQKDLDTAAEEFKLSENAYSEQRDKELADIEFESGVHFTDDELAWLKKKKKPALTMDQTSGQVAKVTNQPVHRMIVVPNGGGADPKSAEYWQGICRRIENLSGAEDVYKWGRRHAVVMGRGFWRVRADYYNQIELRPDGQYDASVFQQDIRIEPILFQHSVYEDPRCKQLDFADMRFCIITSDVEWSEFQRLHPKAKNRTHAEFRGVVGGPSDQSSMWFTEKSVRVAERYYIEDQELSLCMLKPGTVLQEGSEPLGAPTVVVKSAKAPKYPKDAILSEHTFRIPKVKWMKYTRAEILERADVPGRYIPVVKIVGERRIVKGKEDCRGMVRMAKDPQRLVDFYESRSASTVDLAAYDTWMVANDAVEGFDDDYANAHIDRPGLLRWNHKDEQNNPIPEPRHITVAPEIAGIVLAAQRAGMNLRHVLGVPDVTPEEKRPEQSGRAIKARREEQQQATSHYGDSTKSGIRHTARIILSMGREIYDAPRILRINGADDKETEIVVFGQQHAEAAQQLAMQGVQQPNQIRHMLAVDAGQFDVTVTAGKGTDTARQETREVIGEILPVLPPPMAIRAVGTLLKNMDGPGMVELAQKLSPSDESGMVPAEQMQEMQQQAEAMMQQAAQKIGQLEQQIQSKRDELTTQMQIAEMDNAAKIQIEQIKQSAEVQKAEIASWTQMHAPQQPEASPEFGR